MLGYGFSGFLGRFAVDVVVGVFCGGLVEVQDCGSVDDEQPASIFFYAQMKPGGVVLAVVYARVYGVRGGEEFLEGGE